MEINISEFFRADVDPMDYSASVMEVGNNAGPMTWNNALHSEFNFLDTDEKKDAFREYVAGFGAWDDDEINEWDDKELNGLFVQFIASDVRESGIDIDNPDWEAYEQGAEEGQYSGRLFGDNLGNAYYTLD